MPAADYLLEYRSSWAQSLAALRPVEEQKVELLLQLCAQPTSSEEDGSQEQLTIREVAANLLPLISFVLKSGGQRVDLVMPEVARQLPLLTTGWAEPVSDPEALEKLFGEVFTALRSVVRHKGIKASWRQVLSAAVGDLLIRLAKAVLRMPADSPAASSSSSAAPLQPGAPALVMLRTLTRSDAFASAAGLPLLPVDAEVLLTWLVENVLPQGGKVPQPSPAAAAPPAGSRAAVAAAAAGDERVLLLAAALVRTMLGSGEAAALLQQGGAAAEAAATKQRSLLTTLLTWSMGLIRGVLAKLLQPATGVDAISAAVLSGKQPAPQQEAPGAGGAAITRAAARLAASAMRGLLLLRPQEAAGGALPAAARAQLLEVISMMLDMSEACVSAALEIGAQAASSDKMLDTASYILEDCSSLIITAAREAAHAAAAATLPNGSPSKPGAPGGAAAADVGIVFSRLKAILLAAAALVGPASAAEGGWSGFWAWDVSRPLTASYAGAATSASAAAAKPPGWGAQRLCCNVAESLTCGLAASYLAGNRAYVSALLLLPLSLPDGGTAAATNEAEVLSLAMGRLFVLLRGDEGVAQRMVPLLTDVLGQGLAMGAGAGTGVAAANGGAAASTGGSSAVVALQASVVQTLAAMASCSVREERTTTWAYGQISDVLLRLLLESRHPASPAAALAAAAKGPGAGALSAGLLTLAKGMRRAPSSARRDLRSRLLVQFSELALRAGAQGAAGTAAVAELGALLPAVAEACEAAEEGLGGLGFMPSTSRLSLNGAASVGRGGGGGGKLTSMTSSVGAQKADIATVKLLRNLWLYCALFGLTKPAAAPEQLAAAGRIAAVTPMILLADGAFSEQDVAEQLKAELGDRLRLAGEAVASPARLRASLQSALGVAVGGNPQPPPDTNMQAYLLAVATAELCRAKHAPRVLDAEYSPISMPLMYLQSADPAKSDAAWYTVIAEKSFEVYLARLKAEAAAAVAAADRGTMAPVPNAPRRPSYTGLPASPSGGGVRVAPAPLNGGAATVHATSASPFASSAWPGDDTAAGGDGDGDADGDEAADGPVSETGVELLVGGAAGGASSSVVNAAIAAAAECERCLEALAVALIRHLGVSGGHQDGMAPLSSTVADRLLKRLLEAYSPIYWSHACVAALLGELETEEGVDHPLSEVQGASNLTSPAYEAGVGAGASGGGPVWRWLKSWVYAAARAAPTRTEAMLHQFLGQSSVAAYTLGGDGAVGGGAANAILAGVGGGGGGGAAQRANSLQAAAEHHRAHVAALRRAADLLAICADARRRAAGGAGAGVAADGTMALCRKLFFAGAVVGVQFSAGGPSAGPTIVAEKVLAALEEALAAAHTNVRMLEQRYLGAAAFLAREAAEAAEAALVGSEAHALAYRLLQSLCTAPLKRFTPDMMGLAVFAWTWITTAGPAWLVPLVSRTAAVWSSTVDRGLGLFSGAWTPDASGGAVAAAAAEDGSGSGFVSAAGPPSAEEAALLAALSCHHQWVAFLFEMWSSAGDRTDAEQRALALVFDRLLHHSLSNPERLSSHPAAAAPLFRLLQLTLAFCQHCARMRPAGAPVPPSHALLYDRVLRAGLLWFAHAPSFTARMSQRQAEEQHAAVSDFAALLGAMGPAAWPVVSASAVYDRYRDGQSAIEAAGWPSNTVPVSSVVWGAGAKGLRTADAASLLSALCRNEVARLTVWARPLAAATAASSSAAGAVLGLSPALVKIAWMVSPKLAVAVVQRCPAPASNAAGGDAAHRTLEKLLIEAASEPRVQELPEAALFLATPEAARANAPHLAALATWAPAGAVEGLQLMAGPALLHAGVKAYALRCLHATAPAKVAFFLPQLVQALRNDADGATARFLLDTAVRDDLFLHQLIWALVTEERPPPEEFNPEVKRSGWQPPADTGLWEPAARLKERVLSGMTAASAAYWNAENDYFNQVTSISGILKKLEPDERRAKIRSVLQTFSPSRPDLYVPTNPDCRVLAHIPESGTPMQSAAKVPILVAFKVEQQQPAPLPPITRSLACIFKVGDDCRQDVLALQVISILKGAFRNAGLDLYLCPYGCIPTGYGRGVIEVVPHTKSRAALGELSDRGLHEIFVSQFGPPGTPAFERARHNFIVSEAAYAVASFILQAKDRHNGNLLIDSSGRLVHIDFGFILEISPGGNMGFESAAFKLSHEMTQLLDPGGLRNSAHFRLFEELVVRGYLAARTVAEPIIATVALMADSGLPCFGHGKPLPHLRRRFHLEMSEGQAAAFMRAAIADAYQKWTTGFYDYIQNLQNRIPY
ncbi:hypothetical protein HYH02_008923 [Chlamydomonas schloesseri]|uniref:1-phosphatidylinositol 4-kinase n=1 Tax=Chlamydomonas schloesseri TaxID=2026947 RepID=A0A836B1N1_9CHLO|nr:hypothetical protein HYH02_008923 [Chlamydomonas schloesseri]|eukprot:KAG2445055.1 hypothetical protein HYH02_008923 [Chlamydomonas schloesseri]